MDDLNKAIVKLQALILTVEAENGKSETINELKQHSAKLETMVKAIYEDYWQSSSSPHHWDYEYVEDNYKEWETVFDLKKANNDRAHMDYADYYQTMVGHVKVSTLNGKENSENIDWVSSSESC